MKVTHTYYLQIGTYLTVLHKRIRHGKNGGKIVLQKYSYPMQIEKESPYKTDTEILSINGTSKNNYHIRTFLNEKMVDQIFRK